MKIILLLILSLVFIAGIALVITSDSGIITNFYSAHIAGVLLSLFSGVCLSMCIYFYIKSK